MELDLVDAGFSSGENNAALNGLQLESFITVHGGYKQKREGLDYDKLSYTYSCGEGQKLEFVQIGKEGGYYKKNILLQEKNMRPMPKKKRMCWRLRV